MRSDIEVIENPSPMYAPEEYVIKLYSFETDTFTIVNKITTKENYQEHFNSLVAVLGDFDVTTTTTTEEFTYTLSSKVKVVKKGYLFNTVADKVLNIYSLSLLKIDTTLSQLWNDTTEIETEIETETETETEMKSTQTDTETVETENAETDTDCSPKLFYTNQEWMNYAWTYPPASDPFPDMPYQQLLEPLIEPLIEPLVEPYCTDSFLLPPPSLVHSFDEMTKYKGYGDNPFVFDWSKPRQKPVKKMKHVFHDMSFVNEEVKSKLALPNFGLRLTDTKFKLH
jgi:hypothetical protein